MSRGLSQYAFLNAKLRTRLGTLLPEEVFLSLRRAPSLDAALPLLSTTPYGGLSGTLETIEAELLAVEIRDLAGIASKLTGPTGEYAKVLLIRYHVELLKRALRGVFSRQVLHTEPGALFIEAAAEVFPALPLRQLADSPTLDEAASLLAGTGYDRIVEEEKVKVLDSGSLFSLENRLDRYFHTALQRTIDTLPSEDRKIAGRMAGIEIDTLNISWVCRFIESFSLPADRAVEFMIPGGLKTAAPGLGKAAGSENPVEQIASYIGNLYPGFESLLSVGKTDTAGRLSLFEAALEALLDREIRHVLFAGPFTIGILPAYSILKRREIRNLISALNTAFYGHSSEEKAASL